MINIIKEKLEIDETLMKKKEDVFNYIPEKVELEDGCYVIVKDGEYVD